MKREPRGKTEGRIEEEEMITKKKKKNREKKKKKACLAFCLTLVPTRFFIFLREVK